MIGCLRQAAIAALLLAVAACGLFPPAEGIPQAGPAGMDEVIAHFGIDALKPESGRPLLLQAEAELAKSDPLAIFRGVTYGLSDGNRLPGGWLVQTPKVWGMAAASLPFLPLDCPGCDPDLRLPVCSARCPAGRCAPLAASVTRPGARPARYCLGHSDALLDLVYDLLSSAQQSVDITLLQPPADHRFLAALRNAVTLLAHSGRAVTLRFLVGSYPPEGTHTLAFLKELVRDATAVRESRLMLYAASMRPCEPPACPSSWNHAKIVAVDGRRALVGGHNFWTQDYLLDAPVHDLSMRIDGPAVRAAHAYADALWRFACANSQAGTANESYVYVAGRAFIDTGCLPTLMLPPAAGRSGAVPVLSVARLGSGIVTDFANQSQLARTLLLGAARRSIRMVQQDVAFALPGGEKPSWPNSDLERIADLLAAGGEVFIVLSNQGATGTEGGYSNGTPIEDVARHIRTVTAVRTGIAEPQLSRLLCAKLNLAPLRFGPDSSWPGNRPIGVHAKFWMIDDRIFHIGSENLYPVDLQEFGYIVDARAAASEIRRDYWDPLWRWSKLAAISGAGAPRCVFAEP
jgi:phosphatidylserine/phosphatidylglycerophosphate/cardiolipin synthase-like enzyme